MEPTELLLCRGNFGFNWRPAGGRAGEVGEGMGSLGQCFGKINSKESPRREKNDCGLDVWEEVLHGLCV